jgi:hypothetical protein
LLRKSKQGNNNPSHDGRVSQRGVSGQIALPEADILKDGTARLVTGDGGDRRVGVEVGTDIRDK